MSESAYIDSVFGPDGIFAKARPGYEHRPEQMRYAAFIDTRIEQRRIAAVEAGCGTGKSYGYLVPAIRLATSVGRTVVIATANIALQEQLVQKDLPMLAKLLPTPFTFALIKGKNNFLCSSRLDDAEGDDPAWADEYEKELLTLHQWDSTTMRGDVSELDHTPKPAVWSRVCGDQNDCDRDRCMETDCHYWNMRGEAYDADIVICNYHLLFSELKVIADGGLPGAILPEFHHIICDEAHEMAEIARDFFGYRMARAVFFRIAKQMEKWNRKDFSDLLMNNAQLFFNMLEAYRKRSDYKSRIRHKDCVARDKYKPLLDTLAAIMKYCYQAMTGFEGSKDDKKRDRMIKRCKEIINQIDAAMSLTDENAVFYIEMEMVGVGANRKEQPVLHSKLINPAPLIRATLWDRVTSAVVTSATLTTGHTFDFIKRQLGLPEEKDPTDGASITQEDVVDSPFDFENQALFVVPEMKTDPTAQSFPDEVATKFEELVIATRGRTLGLFTSYRVMNVVATALKRSTALQKLGIKLLVQGEGPRTMLVDQFRNDTHSVLIGVSSMWTGVDVPGESLSCLAIDKLPFPNPTDPIIDVLNERDKASFFKDSIPRAVITFRQGFGRLIRSKTDTGVIVAFDKRIVEKGYGAQFTKSLPKVQFTRDIALVKTFIDLCDEERVAREVAGK